jgi:hypothetical protein
VDAGPPLHAINPYHKRKEYMKIRRTLAAVVCVAVAGTVLFGCTKKYSGEWVAKIDNENIYLEELNTYYYAQQKSMYNLPQEKIDEMAQDPAQVAKNPTLDKFEFLEQLIRQRLVYNKAIADGTRKNKEVDALIAMATEAVVVGYYVREKFKNDIEPSADEMKKAMDMMGNDPRIKMLPIEQKEQIIRQQMQQQKLQMKLRELVETLRDEKGIKKNIDALKKSEPKKAGEKK